MSGVLEHPDAAVLYDLLVNADARAVELAFEHMAEHARARIEYLAQRAEHALCPVNETRLGYAGSATWSAPGSHSVAGCARAIRRYGAGWYRIEVDRGGLTAVAQAIPPHVPTVEDVVEPGLRVVDVRIYTPEGVAADAPFEVLFVNPAEVPR